MATLSRNKLRAMVREGSSGSPALRPRYLQGNQMRPAYLAPEDPESGQNLKAKEVPPSRRASYRCSKLPAMVVIGAPSWEQRQHSHSVSRQ